jgi:hypothetical protein
MSVMNRSQFRKELQYGLNAVFGLEYQRYPDEWPAIFDTFQSEKAYEEDVLVSGFAGAPTKAEGAGIAYDSASEVYVSRYFNNTIALAFAITEEASEDNLYGDLGSRYSRALARSMQYTKEVQGAAILNNGFTSTFTGGDGVQLFSTAHPLKSGATAANTPVTPAQLAEASLEDTLVSIMGVQDDRGIPAKLKAVRLIVPQQLYFIANRILHSPYRPGTADNDINVINQNGLVSDGVSIDRYLTNPTAWFIKTDCPDGLKHFQRVKLQRGMEGDFESGNLRYKARERYSFGWSDWRGMFANPGG